MMLPRLRGDGPPRSVADLELPLAGVFALTVGLLVMVWLNGLGGGTADSDEIRRIAERPQHVGVRAELAAGAAQRRAEAARARVRVRRVRAARLARRRAAAAAAAQRSFTEDRTFGSRTSEETQGYTQSGRQPYTGEPTPQSQGQTTPAPAPKPQPKAKPQPSRGGGGGGGFDDSG